MKEYVVISNGSVHKQDWDGTIELTFPYNPM